MSLSDLDASALSPLKFVNTMDCKPQINGNSNRRSIPETVVGSSSSSSQHVIPRSQSVPPVGQQLVIPRRYASYDGTASAIRHNSLGMARHPITMIPRSRLPPGVDPNMIRHRVFVIPNQGGLHPSSVVLRRRVTTRSISSATDVSGDQLEEMEKKVADFDIYKTAFEDKMRKEMEMNEKVSILEKQNADLSKESSELRNELEKLKEEVRNHESEKQALIKQAKEDKQEFEWKQSCYQNEIERFEERMEKMQEINGSLIKDWNELGKKHTAAMAALDTSDDDDGESMPMPCLSKQLEGDSEVTKTDHSNVSTNEEGEERSGTDRPITRLQSGTLPPPLLPLVSSASQSKSKIIIKENQIHEAVEVSEGKDSYDCTCGKTFSHLKRLKHHVRCAHKSLEKSFACTFCSRRFTWGYMLRKHETDVHKIVRPRGHVACQICGSHFPSWKQMAHHKMQKHRTKATPSSSSNVRSLRRSM